MFPANIYKIPKTRVPITRFSICTAIYGLQARRYSLQVPDTPLPSVSDDLPFSSGLTPLNIPTHSISSPDLLTMIKEQWLRPVLLTSVPLKIKLRDAISERSTAAEFSPGKLSVLMNTKRVNDAVFSAWRRHHVKSTIVHCVNADHALGLQAVFESHGVDARGIHAVSGMKKRNTLLLEFEEGKFPVLLYFGPINSISILNIDCIMLVRPTRSQDIFARMITLPSSDNGEVYCSIVDFVDSAVRSPPDVISLPKIFDLDPSTAFENKTIEALEQLASEQTAADTTSPNVTAFINESLAPSPLNEISSKHTWENVAPNAYVLDMWQLQIGYYILVLRTDEGYLGLSRYKSNRTESTICKESSLQAVISKCDSYISHRHSQQSTMLTGDTAWKQEPVSELQKFTLRKRIARKMHGTISDRTLNRMNRGQVATVLMCLEHRHSATTLWRSPDDDI